MSKRIIPIMKADNSAVLALGLPTIEEVDHSASANSFKLSVADVKALDSIESKAMEITDSHGLTYPEKMTALVELADEGAKIAGKLSACSAKCSHCCKMAVVITGWEARRIGKYISVVPEAVWAPVGDVAMMYSLQEALKAKVASLTGVPCPFLVNDLCSVYDVRPLVCRTHHNISEYQSICDLELSRMDVPNLNFSALWTATGYLGLMNDSVSDIRDYFPDPYGLKKNENNT